MSNRLSADLNAWSNEWREAGTMPIDVQDTDDSILIMASIPDIGRGHIMIDLRDSHLLIVRMVSRDLVRRKR